LDSRLFYALKWRRAGVIRAVLFDFDGTLTEPGSLDFAAIRKAVDCPEESYILEHIETLPEGEIRENARGILHRFELEAAASSRPNRGAEDLVCELRRQGIKLAILTRNTKSAILRALENFRRVRASDFELILSRDDSLLPKPSPAAVLHAAQNMGVTAGELLVVGDFEFDIEAGRRAGAPTAFLTNGAAAPCPVVPDYTIETLPEIAGIVRMSQPLAPGKLPNDLLRQFLHEFRIGDSSLLVSPGVGEDVAAVETEPDTILVLKSDPVTFATDREGLYAVTVNANDVATAGATPKWLLVSLLFPPGTTPGEVRSIFQELSSESRRQGLVLCGGHTEITDAVVRPVIAGAVAGTVRRGRLIQKSRMRSGDHLLMTKGVAIEGTSIVAREFGDRLRGRGVSQNDIERCRALLTEPGMSVLREARIAADSGYATAMHDVTEGGIATAVAELSEAGRHRIRVYPGRIPVLEETRIVCRALGLDPLGLIGSGTLLITCDAGGSQPLVAEMEDAGIQVTRIGEVLGIGTGVDPEGPGEWPEFPVDEITRLVRGTDG
jgi:HAD superfamily hydrolase (TIGR01509 family)